MDLTDEEVAKDNVNVEGGEAALPVVLFVHGAGGGDDIERPLGELSTACRNDFDFLRTGSGDVGGDESVCVALSLNSLAVTSNF